MDYNFFKILYFKKSSKSKLYTGFLYIFIILNLSLILVWQHWGLN